MAVFGLFTYVEGLKSSRSGGLGEAQRALEEAEEVLICDVDAETCTYLNSRAGYRRIRL